MLRPLLLVAVLATLASGASAQAPTEGADPSAEAAAAQLRPLLDAPARLAATAVLFHERTGRYPTTAFELLASPEAERTGIRRLRLARLDVGADPDALRLDFLLTPTAAEPSDRSGTVTITHDDEGYAAPFHLAHYTDPDFAEVALPVAEADRLRVRGARGELCIDSAYLRARTADGSFAARLPFLDPTEALTVRFTTTGAGRPAGRVVLTPSSP